MDLERTLECGNSWNGTNMFMNEAWEDSNRLAVYTDASGTEDQGRISPYKFLVQCLSVRVKFTNQ